MSIDWRNFVVIFVIGIVLISVAAAIPLYPKSIISQLQNNLSSGQLSTQETYAQQGSLTWWKLTLNQTYEPLSSIINSAGLLTLVLSGIYACFALFYNLKTSKFKKEKDFSNETVSKKEILTANSVSQPEITASNSNNEPEIKKTDSPFTPVPEAKKTVMEPVFATQSEGLKTSEERELLRGILTGLFNNPTVVLTAKRLILGDRSINLNDILEANTEQKRLESLVVLHLKDGTTERLDISPEKSVLTFLSGSLDAQESEMRAGSKATADRWMNAINQQLRQKPESLKETYEEIIRKLKES